VLIVPNAIPGRAIVLGTTVANVVLVPAALRVGADRTCCALDELQANTSTAAVIKNDIRIGASCN
jgi:hypothetical protein